MKGIEGANKVFYLFEKKEPLTKNLESNASVRKTVPKHKLQLLDQEIKKTENKNSQIRTTKTVPWETRTEMYSFSKQKATITILPTLQPTFEHKLSVNYIWFGAKFEKRQSKLTWTKI